MSDKKILVPEGMLKAAVEAVRDRSEFGFHFIDNKDELRSRRARIVAQTQDTLEAALLWLSENPIVPTNEQTQGVCDSIFVGSENLLDPRDAMVEWQRRMFLAPEPEVPEEINDLRLGGQTTMSMGRMDWLLTEAFRRGQKSKEVK